jgi:hypothetical protein
MPWIVAIVVIVVLAGAIGTGAFLLFTRNDEGTVGTTGDGEAGLQPLEPPTAFTADPHPFSVELSWMAPEGEVERYALYRNGELLKELPATKTSFVDDTVLPEQRLTYQIEAAGGDSTSERATIRVRTPAAPLRLARVDGLFRVVARDTEHFGFASFSGDFSTGWRFGPVCAKGPCDIRWNDVNVRQFAGILARHGAGYAGKDQAKFGKCGSRLTDATWAIRFRVVRAATLRDGWRATKIEGTLVQRSPAQLGCVASGADYRITGALER